MLKFKRECGFGISPFDIVLNRLREFNERLNEQIRTCKRQVFRPAVRRAD
jgi:hypothetical protein